MAGGVQTEQIPIAPTPEGAVSGSMHASNFQRLEFKYSENIVSSALLDETIDKLCRGKGGGRGARS